MVDAVSGAEINWAIEHLPTFEIHAAHREHDLRPTVPPKLKSMPARALGRPIELQVLASYSIDQTTPMR
jgi:hypothetical protein